ncbi:MAG TPA: hypothetical protein VLI67_09000 [Vicinamibacteria bacterium]|nr:hypothetical protein [Vicinamibacteria bacterium]
MSRSRLVVLVSMVVVGLGSLAAVGALYLDPARAAVGPLPAEGLLLPADARFVVGVDVRRFTASPFYRKFRAEARPQAFRDLEEKTGLDPERDVDHVLIGGKDMAGRGRGLAIVLGSFDTYKLGRSIETATESKRLVGRTFEGHTEYVFREGAQEAVAVAFLDRQALLIGSQAAVEAALTGRAQGTAPLRANASIMGLLERVKPGSTFWMVGDQSLLQNLPGTVPGPGGGAAITLPALRSLIVTGDLDPVVSLAITGDTPDAEAAKNLANIVTGFVSLMALQASQKPELKGLAQAITVATDQGRVQVNARVPYEMLEALHPRRAGTAPAAPAPPN